MPVVHTGMIRVPGTVATYCCCTRYQVYTHVLEVRNNLYRGQQGLQQQYVLYTQSNMYGHAIPCPRMLCYTAVPHSLRYDSSSSSSGRSKTVCTSTESKQYVPCTTLYGRSSNLLFKSLQSAGESRVRIQQFDMIDSTACDL